MKDLLRRRKKGSSSPNAPQDANRRQSMQCPKEGPSPSELTSSSSFPDGIRALHECIDATVDICFVHGLTGDRESTWTAHENSMPWPKALLPLKLTKARILTYWYDAYVLRKSVASSNRLIDHATNLLNDLTIERAGCQASFRPLIFVAHSLGGRVCKKAILLSRYNPEPHLQDIFLSLKGIIFMGTPHKGAWMAEWAKIPVSALGLLKSTNVTILDVLRRDNELLESIQSEFLAMVRGLREGRRSLEITCFFEELPLPVVGKVVTKDSATLEGYTPLSIHANHSDMVRFASSEDNGFRRLLGELQRWISQLDKEREYTRGSSARLIASGLPTSESSHHDRRSLGTRDGIYLQKLQMNNLRDNDGLTNWPNRDPEKDNSQRWCQERDGRLLQMEETPGKGKTNLF